jgi:hypothetical protein
MGAEAPAQQRMLGGRAIRGGRVWPHAGLIDRYPGTRQRKNRGNERGKFRRGGRSASFFYVCVSRFPPPALDVTGDLDKEDRRVGRRGNDLGGGLTGCGGRIDEHPREEGFFASLFLPIWQDRSQAGARLGWPVVPPERRPANAGRHPGSVGAGRAS